MLHRFAVFDVDGTVRLPSGAGRPPKPPRPLGREFHTLKRVGLNVMAATGASLQSLRATERDLNFKFGVAAVSHCGRVIRRGGITPSELMLVSRDDLLTLGELFPSLDRIRERHGGDAYDRSTAYTMFFVHSHGFTAARNEVEALVSPHAELRFTANPHDGGITVMPTSLNKALIIQFVREVLNGQVVLAAGDTASDLPLLEAAEFPIATRTMEGSALHPELVDLINRRGVGYMAKEDEPHGFGLLAGIAAAREQGFVA